MKIYANKNRYLDVEYFKGKELWVKIFSVETVSEQYVRILSTGGGYAEYNRISARVIDENFPLEVSFDWVNHILSKKFFTRIDSLLVSQPIEMLTTEEFVEIIREKQVDPL